VPLLTGEDFERLFTTFQHTAFRLEVRERYNGIGYEVEPLRQFLAGQPVDLAFARSWFDLMRSHRAAGRRVERVRVVSRPHSDYTRYALWLCQFNSEAGEDIRYLDRALAVGLPDEDYWLLDSSRLYILRFDDDDNLLGADLIENPATVVQHCFWRDAAWHHATPYPRYIEAAGAVEPPASP
jgi:hypothetical protein